MTSLFLSTIIAAGCVDVEPAPEKQDVRALDKADSGEDYCELYGWYGDGECDDFCVTPDPDCGECPNPEDSGVEYISTDALECAAILFSCEDGEELFSDSCGCGCVADPEPVGECPDANSESVHYIANSDVDPSICLAIAFGCEEGQELFSDECGCGCID